MLHKISSFDRRSNKKMKYTYKKTILVTGEKGRFKRRIQK